MGSAQTFSARVGLQGSPDPIMADSSRPALIALKRRLEIEEEAPAMTKPKTYLESFALRALATLVESTD
jgi:hypothetical protein